MIDWPHIVQEHGPIVWNTVSRLLDNEADAADCFQDTFVSALNLSRPIRRQLARIAQAPGDCPGTGPPATTASAVKSVYRNAGRFQLGREGCRARPRRGGTGVDRGFAAGRWPIWTTGKPRCSASPAWKISTTARSPSNSG